MEEEAYNCFYFFKINTYEEHRTIQMIQGGSQVVLIILQSERKQWIQGISDA